MTDLSAQAAIYTGLHRRAANRVLRIQACRGFATSIEPYDAVVIGGGVCEFLRSSIVTHLMDLGPGGYVAAIKAAQLGLRVSLRSLFISSG